ncbi:MAG: DUF924 domain-containing protein [Thermoanaerobaculales bacterium]|jgi:uncharacterized protein (DUF924 family)|nr:DUF924 domain-containing protein [Thermoanaerobaculales bacterium]
MDPTRDELLALWFGEGGDDAEIGARQAKLWWGGGPETDELLGARFGRAVSAAAAGALDHWTGSPRGRLALILLLDQLPRAIHRGTPAAFAQDAAARRVAERGIDSGADQLLRPIERVFVYLPFEHSEDLADQERSVELLGRLAGEVPEPMRATFQGYLDWAIRHRDVIARFGRFPHRNRVLGRASTPEELEFLTQPGSSF